MSETETTDSTAHVPAVLLTYEDDADLKYDDAGRIANHDELVEAGQTYREVRVLDRETVERFEAITELDEAHPLWCEPVAELEPGDSLRVDELKDGGPSDG